MSFEGVEPLSAYLKSMPAEYRASFDIDAARAHEAIVRRRGDRAIHVEIWRELSERVVAICVVADDRPGLLSCISAALVASRIDVVSAHAYCRKRPDGGVEAVDLLWIRRLPGPTGLVPPIRARDIVAVAEAIEQTAAADVREPSSSMPPSASAAEAPATQEAPHAEDGAALPGRVTGYHTARDRDVRAGMSARVRFATDEKDGATILTVEAFDRPGLLLAVTQALFRAGVQIVGLRATTERSTKGERACAVDRFTLAEVDGTPLRRDRLLALQAAILGALDESGLAPQRRTAG